MKAPLHVAPGSTSEVGRKGKLTANFDQQMIECFLPEALTQSCDGMSDFPQSSGQPAGEILAYMCIDVMSIQMMSALGVADAQSSAMTCTFESDQCHLSAITLSSSL